MSISDSHLHTLARSQLNLPLASAVPRAYLVQLKEHLRHFPHDTNFVVALEPREGFGQLLCQETGCLGKYIPLTRNNKIRDGGMSDGLGNFTAYHNHIQLHPTHMASRDERLQQQHSNFQRAGNHVQSQQTPMPAASSSFLIRSSSLNDLLALSDSSSTGPQRPTLSKKRPSDPLESYSTKRVKAETPPAPRQALATRNLNVKEEPVRGMSQINRPQYSDLVNRKPQTPKVKEETPSISRLALLTARRLSAKDAFAPDFADPFTPGDVKPDVKPLVPGRALDPYYELTNIYNTPGPSAPRRASIQAPPPAFEYTDISDDDDPNDVPAGDLFGEIVTQVGLRTGLDYPMDPIRPLNADKDYDAFFAAAGNAETFSSNQSVSDALKKLGLRDLKSHPFPGMTINLLPHQALGVAWMNEQETEKSHNGGILADEMGLGKTIQMIATIMFNPARDPQRRTTLVVAPLALLGQWKNEIQDKCARPMKVLIYHGQSRPKDPNTLIEYDVVLTTYGTLVCEWPDNPNRTTGTRRKSNSAEEEYSGDSDDGEDSPQPKAKNGKAKAKRPKRGNVLFKVDWYRVVLDEAQNIRNKTTRVSEAVTCLKSIYNWCLTGTPITNSLADGYGLLRFLKVRPWYDWTDYRDHIMKFERRDPTLAAARLQAIFKVCLMRRKKDSELDGKKLVELLPKHYHLDNLVFTKDEQDVYNMLQARSRAIFNRYLRAGTVLKNYAHVLVLLLRLRQCAVHPSLIAEFEDAFLKDGEIRPSGVAEETFPNQIMRAAGVLGMEWVAGIKNRLLVQTLERMEAEKRSLDATIALDECPICVEVLPIDARITSCGHVFCYGCIDNVLNTNHVADEAEPGKYGPNDRPCPSCRGAINRDRLFHREAFMPTNAELGIEPEINEAPLPELPKVAGNDSDEDSDDYRPVKSKASSRASSRRSSRRSNSRRVIDDTYDSDDDFVVQEGEDEAEKDAKRDARKARLAAMAQKKKKRVDSESEYEGSDSSEAEEDNDVEMSEDGEGIPAFPRKKKGPRQKRKRMTLGKFLPSTKMMRMMEILTEIRNNRPNEKTMIVSQWTSVLELCESYLSENGFKHVSYRGDMSGHEREQAVRRFMRDESINVMLMSCKAGGVGLNLTRGNHVISLDFAWSTAVENQAFDRLHRLGQTREVHIRRLAIANTVESKILDLQAKKQNLADGSLGENGGTRLGQLSVKQLANLFGLNTRGDVID